MSRHVRKVVGAALGLVIAFSGVAQTHTAVLPTDISAYSTPTGTVEKGTVVRIYVTPASLAAHPHSHTCATSSADPRIKGPYATDPSVQRSGAGRKSRSA